MLEVEAEVGLVVGLKAYIELQRFLHEMEFSEIWCHDKHARPDSLQLRLGYFGLLLDGLKNVNRRGIGPLAVGSPNEPFVQFLRWAWSSTFERDCPQQSRAAIIAAPILYIQNSGGESEGPILKDWCCLEPACCWYIRCSMH